ncbi:hypothetical protein VZ95_17755 [Elstera litoralis]|uniref:Uncharacterized protein n=1 Tax=Elstera litoralis TaxID=552518 RepID=A0A0F3IPG5_9PROT|nr:hypothetical protein [Elstera litoralis]KJV08448.1 hypothetical protein VZ95_17755 [Elstera litoralis]
MADIHHLRGRNGTAKDKGEASRRLSRVPIIVLKVPRQTAANDNPAPWARRLAQVGLVLLIGAALVTWVIGLPKLW